MTKAEERKVLAQIRKLVESTGENSYIAMAFEGVLEDAEENIENDFGCSWKQRAESAEKKITEYKKVRDELVEEREELQKTIEAKNEQIDSLVEQLQALRAERNDAQGAVLMERKEIKVETADRSYFGQFLRSDTTETTNSISSQWKSRTDGCRATKWLTSLS